MQNIQKDTMKKYYILMVIYISLVFISAEIYSFVYDIEVNNHILKDYLDYNANSDDPLTLKEWMDTQDEREQEVLDWFADEFDCALNPWYSSDE